MPKVKVDTPQRKAAIKTYRDITPDWLEKVLEFVVGDPEDPQAQVLQAAMPAPLVTTFANKAARMSATKATRDKLTEILKTLELVGEVNPKQTQKILGIADKYPRTLAHMEDIELRGDLPMKGMAGATNPSGGTVPGRSTVALSPASNIDPVHTFAEELAHTAQGVGLKEFTEPLYLDAQRQVGYKPNPFEINAKNTAQRLRGPVSFLDRLLGRASPPAAGRPVDLMDALKSIGVVDPAIPKGEFMATARKAAKR